MARADLESSAQSSGAAAQAAMQPMDTTPQSGGKPMPIGWTQSVKEVTWENRSDSFGTEIAGENVGVPADSVKSGGGRVVKAPKAEAVEAEAPTDGEVVVEEPAGEEVSEEDTALAEAVAKVDAQTAENEAELDEAAEKGDTKEKVDPEAETPKPKVVDPDKPSALRRKALDALKAEGEKREITQRLQAERDARVRDKAAFDAKQASLTRMPLAERLKAIGIRDKDHLLEIAVSGEIDDAAMAVTPKAPAVDPEKVELLARLDRIEKAEQARLAAQSSADTQRALDHVRSVLLLPDVGGHYTLAAENGVQATLEHADALWKAGGSPQDEASKQGFYLRAAREAEAFFEGKAKPMLDAERAKAAAKGAPVPAASIANGAKPTTATVPAAKKVAVSGKRLAARPTLDDDGPQDPLLRDAWIKNSTPGLH